MEHAIYFGRHIYIHSVLDLNEAISLMAVERANVSLGDFVLLDDLFRLRAADSIQVPLIGIHKPEATAGPYELLTAQHLNRFIDHSAKHYVESNLRIVRLIVEYQSL